MKKRKKAVSKRIPGKVPREFRGAVRQRSVSGMHTNFSVIRDENGQHRLMLMISEKGKPPVKLDVEDHVVRALVGLAVFRIGRCSLGLPPTFTWQVGPHASLVVTLTSEEALRVLPQDPEGGNPRYPTGRS